MELVQLQTFINLIHYQNFSQVAKKMNVSQPTVTVRIKALEEEIGVALIIRVGRKIKITPAGQKFYDYIERSMRVLQDGILTVTTDTQDCQSHFTIATTHTAASYFLTDIITNFYFKHKIDLSVYAGHTREVLEMIKDQVALIGVVNSTIEYPDLIKFKLYDERFYLTVVSTHPLVHQQEVSIQDLIDEPLINFEEGHNFYFRIETLFRELGITSNTIMHLRDVNSVKKMVREGNGIAFLPWAAIKKDVECGILSILPLNLTKPLTREVHLVVHRINYNVPMVKSFIEEVKSYLRINMKNDEYVPQEHSVEYID